MKNVLLKTFVSLAKEYDRILTESVRRGRWLDQLILRWSTIYKNNNGTVGWNFLIKVICERGRAPIVPLETSSKSPADVFPFNLRYTLLVGLRPNTFSYDQ